jgi:hypothetical protein
MLWQIARQIKKQLGVDAELLSTIWWTQQENKFSAWQTKEIWYNWRTTSYLTISKRNSHGQGRTEGIVRGNRETTKGRFNRSGKGTEGVCKLGFYILWGYFLFFNLLLVFILSMEYFRDSWSIPHTQNISNHYFILTSFEILYPAGWQDFLNKQ